MKQNSFQKHVAFGKTITFNPDFTIVLWWAGSTQIILLFTSAEMEGSCGHRAQEVHWSIYLSIYLNI
jgi:hypothetical protein